MNSQLQMNPYAILQIDRGANLQEVKKAYRSICKIYHPDKGGNAEMFRILQQAYQTILKRFPQERSQPDIYNRGDLRHDNFTRDRFNNNFVQHQNAEEDYVYGVDTSGYVPRNIADYRRDRNSIDDIKPLFTEGMSFNKNVFNRMFEKLKDTNNQMVVHQGHPQALVSQNAIGFSDVNPHSGQLTDISTSDLNNNFGNYDQSSFKNPTTINKKEYRQMKKQPDITKVNKLSQKDMKSRVGTYKNSKHVIQPGGQKPPQGDLDYNFDPYYNKQITYNQPQIEYQPQPRIYQQHQQYHQQQNQPQSPLHPQQHNPQHPPQQYPQQYSQHPQQQQQQYQQQQYQQQQYQPQQYSQPPQQQPPQQRYQQQHSQYHQSSQQYRPQQRRVVSYGSNSGKKGSPMTPNVTYYQTTVMREQRQPVVQDGNMNRIVQLEEDMEDKMMEMREMERKLEKMERLEQKLRTLQSTPQVTHDTNKLEEELEQMRRKVKIQDRLIRKIRKKGMMS